MIGSMAGKSKRAMAERFLKSDAGRAVIGIVTEAERALVASVVRQHDVLGIDTINDLPSTEDRAEQLRDVALARLNGRFPAHIVDTYLDLDNAEEAAEFADLTGDEWQAAKEEWAEGYREQGVEGDVDELARAHVRTRYGVDLESFYHLVVHWPDGRKGDELESIVASGLRTARRGIEQTTNVLEAADVDIDQDVVDEVVAQT